jgi:signal peptidase II
VRSAIGRALLVGAGAVAADQATKALVRATVERGERQPFLPGIEIVNSRNSGVAFGLFADAGAIVAALTATALLALVVWFALHVRRPLAWLPTGLLLGGAVGNLVDRIREGAVTDFIDLPLWPSFNIADVCITVGVLALLYVLEGPPREKEPAASG